MVFDKIKAYLIEQDIPDYAITESTHLQNDLGFDSLDVCDLLFQAEDMFNVIIPDAKDISMKKRLHNATAGWYVIAE